MKIILQRLILVFVLFCIAKQGTSQTILLNESFSSGLQPVGWSQDSAGVTPLYTWLFNNPNGQTITGAGFDGSFVIFDSDFYGEFAVEDCYLNLPTLNATGLLSLYLTMDEQYRDWATGFHQIEVSIDGGANWTHLLTDTSTTDLGYPVAVHSVYDLTALAAGQASVKIRFHYAEAWGYWWAIDNVVVADANLCFAGETGSTDTYSCGTDTFVLNLPNGSGGSNFQWESSPDGINWTPMAGDTLMADTVSQLASSYYHCVVTCGSFTSVSTPVFVNTGPPAGIAFASVSPVCDTLSTFDLRLEFDSTESGLSHQWQYSYDNVSWFNMPGANTDSVIGVTLDSSTYYRCEVGCGATTNTSLPVRVLLNNSVHCYCAAVNEVPCVFGQSISNVNINGTLFDNTTTCDSVNIFDNYSQYPPSLTTTADLLTNNTYDVNVTTSFDAIVSIWIDYNANGVYDTTEWTQVCTTSVSGIPNTVSITIPGSAIVGPTGMRVRSRLTANDNGSGDACTLFGSGETEDYIVGIQFSIGMSEVTQNGISMYPNPNAGDVNFIFSDFHDRTSVKIYDALGSCVADKTFSNTYKAAVDISSGGNGLYVVKMENSKGVFTRKLILNK